LIALVDAIRGVAFIVRGPTLSGEASAMSVKVPRSPFAVALTIACPVSGEKSIRVTTTPESPCR